MSIDCLHLPTFPCRQISSGTAMTEDVQNHVSGTLSNNDKAVIEDTLHFVAERSWQLSGENFFREMVNHLGNSLKVEFATCGVITADQLNLVESVAFFSHGEIIPNVRYSTDGAPCANIVGQKFCGYSSGVAELFPEDIFLVDKGIASYAGIPLWASDRTPLGIINIMSESPLENLDMIRTVMQILAVRTGAELERFQVLEKLRESERRFVDFASVSSDWFWETDENLRFSYFSPTFEDVIGTPPENLLGRTREEIGAPGSSPEALRGLIDDMAARRPFRDFQHYRIKSSGEIVDVSISGRPAFDENGRFVGYRGSGQDISRQKSTERQLIESRDAAYRASRAKSEFLAKMSHEFRTPLNAILGMSEIIADSVFGPIGNDKYLEYADDIHRSGKHMLSLINDVLDIAAIEAGKRALEKRYLDVAELLSQALRDLEPTAAKAGIETEVTLQEDFPHLYADDRAITQIVLNLLSNAIKYTEPGGRVTVTATHGPEDIRIDVADTGIGIPAEALPHVMEPFSQAQADPHLQREGTGLGLSIVQALVKDHGGSVSIDSRVGEGTTVIVLLPLTPELPSSELLPPA